MATCGGAPRSEARSCEGYPPQGPKSRKEQKDAPPEGLKGHKEPKETPPQGPTWQNGRPKGQNGGREAKMKAQKAKMKGNEAPQTKNEENQRPQKIDPATAPINSLYGTLGQRTVFGNLWGGPHGEGRHKKKCY